MKQAMRDSFLRYCVPQVGEEEIAEVVRCLRSGWLTTGPEVQQFEAEFARYVGAAHAVAVNSCTSALHLLLRALDVGPGDEVIVPTLTFCATANVAVHLGAKPVLVDVDEYCHLDLDAVARAITPKTKAIIPVHYGGLPCDMTELLALAAKAGIPVIEDAAHAVGAEYDGRKIGTHGLAVAFSFYATKNLCTGEGGMVTTNNEALAARVRLLSLHGMSKDAWQRYAQHGSWHYDVLEAGYKCNMPDIQAALGIHQLRRLEAANARRAELAHRYTEAFTRIGGLRLPREKPGRTHAYHLYAVQLACDADRLTRDEFVAALNSANIGASVHFIPLHRFHFYRTKFGYGPGEFPMAERIWENIVSLPLYPAMTDRDATDVVEAVARILDSVSANRQRVPRPAAEDAPQVMDGPWAPVANGKPAAHDGKRGGFAEPPRFLIPSLPPLEQVYALYRDAYQGGVITNAALVQRFESAAAEFLGARHCVAVSSCTSGLMLVLRCLDLTGNIILPSFTFFATAHAARWAGLRPLFADCDPATWNISPASVERMVTRDTAAILGVHMYGNPCDVEALSRIAAASGAKLIFDAAHAFGSRHQDRAVGQFGDAEVFSLSPTKLLIAGEGGLVATNDAALARRLRYARNYGDLGAYDPEVLGMNARMSEFNAAVALAGLPMVPGKVERRNRIAAMYTARLSGLPGVGFQKVRPGDLSTYKDYSIHVQKEACRLSRDELAQTLAAANIETKKYFYPPLHRQKLYRVFWQPALHPLPNTDEVSDGIISLPIYELLPDDAVETITACIRASLEPRVEPEPEMSHVTISSLRR